MHHLLAASPCNGLSPSPSTLRQSDCPGVIRSSSLCPLVRPSKPRLHPWALPCSYTIRETHAVGTHPASLTLAATAVLPSPQGEQVGSFTPDQFRGSLSHSLMFRPTFSLSTLRWVRCRTQRKTRYLTAGYALSGPPSQTAGLYMLARRNPHRPGRAQCTHPVPQAEPLLPMVQSNGGLVTRLASAASLSCLLPIGSPARRRLPSHGSLGLRFPTFYGTMRRYDCHLSLSGAFACRSFPDTLRASRRLWSPRRARGLVEAPRARQGLWSPGPPCRARCQGDRWLSHVPEFPLGRYAPLSDPGGVLRTRHSAPRTAAFQCVQTVG